VGAAYSRRSIRLAGYDYAQEGHYFVTIVAYKRLYLFGEIVDGEMIPNEAGYMIERMWQEIEDDFPHVTLGEYVLMPNHLHGIIQITKPVGAESISALNATRTDPPTMTQRSNSATVCKRAEMDSAPTLSRMIQSSKRHSTLRYIQMVKNGTLPPFDKRIWQRNFYEHIIRDDTDHARITKYIENNPLTWAEDRLAT
jgi:REP element-mobilizing transposase RayT